MAKATITIPLDPQTARAYDSAAPEQKRKMQALLSLWLRELAAGEYPSLQQVLADVGRKAKERGLTPEMLDSLDRKSTRLNSSHQIISYAVFCLKKKKNEKLITAAS